MFGTYSPRRQHQLFRGIVPIPFIKDVAFNKKTNGTEVLCAVPTWTQTFLSFQAWFFFSGVKEVNLSTIWHERGVFSPKHKLVISHRCLPLCWLQLIRLGIWYLLSHFLIPHSFLNEFQYLTYNIDTDHWFQYKRNTLSLLSPKS